MKNFAYRQDEIRYLRSVALDYRRIARRKNGTLSLADWRAAKRLDALAERAEAELLADWRAAYTAANSRAINRFLAWLLSLFSPKGDQNASI